MFILGICGNSGSGKSSVCRFLAKENIPILDCDEIYHAITLKRSNCLNDIEKRFGKAVIKNDQLDRVALRKVVFQDKNALLELNQITHRHVLEELKNRLKEYSESKEKIVVIDAPLFFEAKLETWCDAVCAVISDYEEQIRRIVLRDGITKEEAAARLSKQMDADELKNKADFVIENSGDLNRLEEACKNLIQTILDTIKP